MPGGRVLDEHDKKILRLLQEDGRMSYRDIAKETRMSTTSVFYRVKKLLGNDVIRRFTVLINPEVLGFSYVMLGLNVDENRLDETIDFFSKLKGVQFLASSVGKYDLSVLFATNKPQELWELVNTKVEGIRGLHSVDISVSTKIHKLDLKLDI